MTMTLKDSIYAALLLTLGVFGAESSQQSRAFAQPEQEPCEAVSRVELPARLLHANSTGAEVERLLGRPTAATNLSNPEIGDTALVYADAPVRTRVLLTGGKVAGIALDVVYVDPVSLPERGRTIIPTMVRDGVTSLLGAPDADQRWTEVGRDFEQMAFDTAGKAEFSVFLADGLVVDVRSGHERPHGLASLLLPTPVPDAAVGAQLAIGLSPAQVAPLLGPIETTIHFALKGEPVEYATYRQREGGGLVTVTFIGGVLTAFTMWQADAS
jgi:hypothetical protein